MTTQVTNTSIPEPKKEEQKKLETEVKVQAPVSTEAASQPQVEESEVDRNWRKFREERKAERKLLEEERKRAADAEKQAAQLKAALEAMVSKQQYQPPIQEHLEETEDQKIQRAVEKALQETEKRRLAEQHRREQEELPQKLAQSFPNFNEVCSDENLDYIQFNYPEIYGAFKDTPESFRKWENVYKTIKKLVPNYNSEKDVKKIEKNASKPQSISVPGMTPTAESIPYKIDEKRRADNWRRMQQTLKGS